MTTSQSQFSGLPKRHLVHICEQLIKNKFTTGNPYQRNFEESMSILESIGKIFNLPNINDEDIQFFSKFIEINKGILKEIFKRGENSKELINQLVIPEAKSYNLTYRVFGTAFFIEHKSQEFDAYDENWVIDCAKQQYDDGIWDMYEGKQTSETELQDMEVTDMVYDEVYQVDDNNSTDTRFLESNLDKLVIENTQDVVSSLDKTTLLKLKSIINSRLRLL